MTNAAVQALAQVALVNVELSTWSGYKRTSEAEAAKIGVKLPKGSPMTKGGKKIYPTEFLNEFTNIRKEISRRLSRYGIRALGGTAQAVPESAVDEITTFLDDVKVRVTQAIVEFDTKYDVRLSDYIKSIQDPVVQSIISASVLPKDDAVSKFGVSWQIFKIVPSGKVEETSKSLVEGMTNSLLDEVAQAAKKIFEDSFLGKPKVSQKALHQVRALRDKMDGLRFLDPNNIDSIVKSMDDTFNSLPANGWIEGKELSILHAVILRLGDPEKMLQHAAMIQAGMSQQDSQQVETATVVETPRLSVTAETKVEEKAEETAVITTSENLFDDVVTEVNPVQVVDASLSEAEMLPATIETVTTIEVDAVEVVEQVAVEVEQEQPSVQVQVEIIDAGSSDDEQTYVEEVTRVSLHEIESGHSNDQRGGSEFF